MARLLSFSCFGPSSFSSCTSCSTSSAFFFLISSSSWSSSFVPGCIRRTVVYAYDLLVGVTPHARTYQCTCVRTYVRGTCKYTAQTAYGHGAQHRSGTTPHSGRGMPPPSRSKLLHATEKQGHAASSEIGPSAARRLRLSTA